MKGSILTELLSEISEDILDTQVKKICDKIYDEEKEDMKNIGDSPKGSNIFLSLQVDYKPKEISFLTLELESANKYISVLYSKKDDNIKRVLKRIKVWEIKSDSKAKKIIKEYVGILKFIDNSL